MIELRTLGTLELRVRNGPRLDAIVTQSKRFALLIFLALAGPRGFHRRDELLGMFWPELDSARAHRALRQSTYFLRHELREDVMLARGNAEIGIREDRLWCDAVALEHAVARGKATEALQLAAGDLLPGFGITGAQGFERWLEDQRARVRRLSASAAWSAAEACEAGDDADGAAEYARLAVSFSPGDELAMRRLILLMSRLGDRATAVRAFDEFAARLARDYELAPSIETIRLIEQIRV